jgi:alpha-L-fucosidase
LPWGRCTKKETKDATTLYLSVFNWPADGKLFIPGIKNKAMSAQLLAGKKVCKTENMNDGIMITLPANAPDPVASVVKLQVKGTVANAALNGKMKTGALD